MRPLFEGRHLAETELVQDLARLLVAERIVRLRLEKRKRAQRRRRELAAEGQGLEAGNEAVAPEERHEPGQARRGQRSRTERGAEPQRGQVDQAALIGLVERLPRRDQTRRRCDPGFHTLGELFAAQLAFRDGRRCFRLRQAFGRLCGADDGHDVDRRAPARMRRKLHLEREAVLGHLAGLARQDPGLSMKSVAAVAENELVAVDLPIKLSLFLELVLDLEEVGEVGRRFDLQLELHRVFVVPERDFL